MTWRAECGISDFNIIPPRYIPGGVFVAFGGMIMFGITGYLQFLLSSIGLNLTPGTDVLYVLGTSVAGGRKRGVLSALGITTGILIHTMLVAFGLAALLASSPLLFNILKWAGAGYLVILGIVTLRKRSSPTTDTQTENINLKAVYLKGILTNVLNPKTLLFFLVLLPQFVAADNSYGSLPFILLGLTFYTTSTVWCMIIALSGAAVGKLFTSPNAQKIANTGAGVIYILLGLNILR